MKTKNQAYIQVFLILIFKKFNILYFLFKKAQLLKKKNKVINIMESINSLNNKIKYNGSGKNLFNK